MKTLKHLFQKWSSMEKNIELLSCSQIWVCSGHNASGYFTVYGDEALQSDHFNSRLSFGDTQTIWARTGYLGFLRRTELTDASGGTLTIPFTTKCTYYCVLSLFSWRGQHTLSEVFAFACVCTQSDTMPCMLWERWMRPWS